jgi:hypothetical protein
LRAQCASFQSRRHGSRSQVVGREIGEFLEVGKDIENPGDDMGE